MWTATNYGGTLYVYSAVNSTYPQNQWFYVGAAPGFYPDNDLIESAYNNRVHESLLSKDWPDDSEQACMLGNDPINNFNSYIWPNGTLVGDSISSIDLSTLNGC
jgi:hypothetical protein